MPILYDESAAPLMVTVFEGEPLVADAQAYTQWMTKHFTRGRPVAIVLDVSQAKSPAARVLTVFGDFAKQNIENDRKFVAGFAYVATSAIVKVVLKGFFALQPPAAPYVVLGSRVEAIAWCKQKLAERGIAA